MPVSYEEISPFSLSADEQGLSATRILKLANHTDAWTFLEELYGTVSLGGSGIIRSGIVTYPNRPWLILKSCNIEPFDADLIAGNDSDGVAYCGSGARVTLTYRSSDYEQDENENENNKPQPYMTLRSTGSQQMMTHPLGALKWEVNNDAGLSELPEDFRPTVPVTVTDHTINWHQLPKVPYAKLRATLNRVNNAEFLGAPAETVLFKSFEMTQTRHVDGSVKFELSLSLAERVIEGVAQGGGAIGWNHFLRPDPGAGQSEWQRIVKKKTGDKIFPAVDLETLFTFDDD